MGYRQSTPINVLLHEAREPPVHFKHQALTIKYLYKNLSLDSDPVINSLISLSSSSSTRVKKISAIKSIPLLKLFIGCRYISKIIHKSVLSPSSMIINHLSFNLNFLLSPSPVSLDFPQMLLIRPLILPRSQLSLQLPHFTLTMTILSFHVAILTKMLIILSSIAHLPEDTLLLFLSI